MVDERLNELMRNAGVRVVAAQLLVNYALREPRRFIEIDGLTNGGFAPDDDGDDLLMTETVELMGDADVVIFINPEARARDVVRLLKKAAEQVADGFPGADADADPLTNLGLHGAGTSGEAFKAARSLLILAERAREREIQEIQDEPIPF